MRKYNPYRNIFYYYRGPSNRRQEEQGDRQIEDNTTKALINTLDKCESGLLAHFLNWIGIKASGFDRVSYDLQIAGDGGRPDALIEVGRSRVFIESKIDCPLDRGQLRRHLESFSNGYLLCITPRPRDSTIVESLCEKRVKFITWQDVYLCFKKYLGRTSDGRTAFVITEFADYLEAISMAPFHGWQKSHFEAFLNTEDDPSKELMLRVKGDLRQYLTELRGHLNGETGFTDLEMKVGNLQVGDYRHCWGVLCVPPLKTIVHKPHFNFIINADEFTIGVQIEGRKPAYCLKAKTKRETKAFLLVLKKLNGFALTVRKRTQGTRPRIFISTPVAQIALGDEVTARDVEFLIAKMDQYPLFEINCTRAFKRDDSLIGKVSFLNHSVAFMKQLAPYYDFCKG